MAGMVPEWALNLLVKRLHPEAVLPTRATSGSVGRDLYAMQQQYLASNCTYVIQTGISVEIPHGYEGQVRGRSGLAKRGIVVHTGTIDSDYRGEVGVIISNFSPDVVKINAGDRIAQLVIAPVLMCDTVEVETLSETERGDRGFGSSGQ